MSEKLNFDKLHNTRDLGGMRTTDGYVIKPGCLYRSGHLAGISEDDAEGLSGFVRTVIDFRTDEERKEQPDREIPGAANIHMSVVDSLTPGISREKGSMRDMLKELLFKSEEARRYMCGLYRALVSDFPISQYRRFFQILRDAEGGVLWHCTAGKDRAGIASVLVEEALGVGREQIVDDYLATNEYLKEEVQHLAKYIKAQAGTNDERADESIRYLFGAERDYLKSYYEAVDEKYGGFDAFLREGLGVDEIIRKELREKYLDRVNCSDL